MCTLPSTVHRGFFKIVYMCHKIQCMKSLKSDWVKVAELRHHITMLWIFKSLFVSAICEKMIIFVEHIFTLILSSYSDIVNNMSPSWHANTVCLGIDIECHTCSALAWTAQTKQFSLFNHVCIHRPWAILLFCLNCFCGYTENLIISLALSHKKRDLQGTHIHN